MMKRSLTGSESGRVQSRQTDTTEEENMQW